MSHEHKHTTPRLITPRDLQIPSDEPASQTSREIGLSAPISRVTGDLPSTILSAVVFILGH